MPRDDDDDPKETTKLVSDGAREMHRYDESHDSYTALVKLLKYKNYDHLVYLSVLIILICFPLGLAALLMALKMQQNRMWMGGHC
ncbi:uncharacterized protein [Dysidea avara]|uniref:uncharacterized protein isoform X2 n=1 Tax=Dysidea avara TaxID=196820 RepID=UPI00331B32C2